MTNFRLSILQIVGSYGSVTNKYLYNKVALTCGQNVSFPLKKRNPDTALQCPYRTPAKV